MLAAKRPELLKLAKQLTKDIDNVLSTVDENPSETAPSDTTEVDIVISYRPSLNAVEKSELISILDEIIGNLDMSSGSSKMYVWTARDLRKLYEYRKNKLIVSDEVDNLHNFITSFAKCSSSDQDWAQYAADNNVPFVIKSARDKWRKGN